MGGNVDVAMTGWTSWMGGRGSALSALAVALLIASACSNRPPDDSSYASALAAGRAAKDAEFAATDDPIPTARHAQFLPLAYFPIDPDYRVPAALKPIDDPTVLEMPTSTGTTRKMRRVGSLEFTLKNQPMKLTVFVEIADPGHLFLPFSDLTSGTETYAAGRFMDLEYSKSGVYDLDFNRAYIPYCYYNPTYECPFPPPENRLKIPIRAGERMKK
jgi:uncharacterized protein (DUF1684 family)